MLPIFCGLCVSQLWCRCSYGCFWWVKRCCRDEMNVCECEWLCGCSMGHLEFVWFCNASAVQTQLVVKVAYLATWIPFTTFPTGNGRAQGVGKSKSRSQGPQRGWYKSLTRLWFQLQFFPISYLHLDILNHNQYLQGPNYEQDLWLYCTYIHNSCIYFTFYVPLKTVNGPTFYVPLKTVKGPVCC